MASWPCPVCTFDNPALFLTCGMCQTKRHQASSASASSEPAKVANAAATALTGSRDPRGSSSASSSWGSPSTDRPDNAAVSAVYLSDSEEDGDDDGDDEDDLTAMGDGGGRKEGRGIPTPRRSGKCPAKPVASKSATVADPPSGTAAGGGGSSKHRRQADEQYSGTGSDKTTHEFDSVSNFEAVYEVQVGKNNVNSSLGGCWGWGWGCAGLGLELGLRLGLVLGLCPDGRAGNVLGVGRGRCV